MHIWPPPLPEFGKRDWGRWMLVRGAAGAAREARTGGSARRLDAERRARAGRGAAHVDGLVVGEAGPSDDDVTGSEEHGTAPPLRSRARRPDQAGGLSTATVCQPTIGEQGKTTWRTG